MTRLPGFVLLAALASCSGSMTSPSTPPPAPAPPVTVGIEPLVAPNGSDTKSFGMVVGNVSQSPVDLTFPSSCQLVPHIVDNAGREVTPIGGGQACATVITHLSLPVSTSVLLTVIVVAGHAPVNTLLVVPPGDYMIYTSLEDDKYQLKSARLAFSVR